jgi:uncharacterized protein (DUF433 family)
MTDFAQNSPIKAHWLAALKADSAWTDKKILEAYPDMTQDNIDELLVMAAQDVQADQP